VARGGRRAPDGMSPREPDRHVADTVRGDSKRADNSDGLVYGPSA
jgi:hypothetical protein